MVVLPFVPVMPTKGRGAQQPVAELDLAPDRHAGGSRSRDRRRLGRHARALDQHVHVPHCSLVAPDAHFDARGDKPAHVDRLRAVDCEHLDPEPCQGQSRRLARSRQAHHERSPRQLGHGRYRPGKLKKYWK